MSDTFCVLVKAIVGPMRNVGVKKFLVDLQKTHCELLSEEIFASL